MPEELERKRSNDLNNQQSKDSEAQENEPFVTVKSKPVIIQAEAYKTIILYASRYANKEIPKPTAKRILAVLRDEKILRTLQEASGRRSAIYAFSELINTSEGENIF